MRDGGTILIPAFSLGRAQEILALIEAIISANPSLSIPVILDSPLAARLTAAYRQLVEHWREPLRQRRESGRMPLGFDQLITVQDHREHLRLVKRLKQSGQPALVLAASGMCQGGRVVNYLQALLDQPETDLVFLGYQARGTLGRRIQTARQGDLLDVAGQEVPMNARIHRLSGFSAHADQRGLLAFCTDMDTPPNEIRLVHGDQNAKIELQRRLMATLPKCKVSIPA